MLDQREESLLNQIRGIRFASGKTNSKLVKRSEDGLDKVSYSDKKVVFSLDILSMDPRKKIGADTIWNCDEWLLPS